MDEEDPGGPLLEVFFLVVLGLSVNLKTGFSSQLNLLNEVLLFCLQCGLTGSRLGQFHSLMCLLVLQT